MNRERLAVEVAGIRMATPVMGASGTFGFGMEYEDFLDLADVGAVVSKGITPKPRAGNGGVRIAETPAGMLNSIGLENPGIEAFCRDILPEAAKLPTAFIVNISAGTAEEYGEMAQMLDVEGVDWLARHLQARFSGSGGRGSGALVTVTHDRWFLDAICTNVWEVVPGVDPGGGRPQVAGRIETYDGGYAAYVLARAERARQAAVAAVKRENLLRKELAWLRRGAPARTSKPRFRIEAAEALIADVPPPRDTVALTAMATARLGKKVLDLEDVTVRYPVPSGRADGADGVAASSEREILRHVTWRLAPGERVGVVGVNGAGKTTLLRLLEGVQEPTGGRVARGKTVQVATLSQSTHELDALADLRVVVGRQAQLRRVAQGPADGEPTVHDIVLGDDADALAQAGEVLVELDAAVDDAATRGRSGAGDGAQQRRLTGA